MSDTQNPTSTVSSASDARTINNVMRHEYRVLTDEEKKLMLAIKDKGRELHDLIASASATGSRELSLAKTKTEEAVMWAVKHLTA
jgi:hypothetical protein